MGKRGPRPETKQSLTLRGSRKAASSPDAAPSIEGSPVKPDWIAVQSFASAKWDETFPLVAKICGLSLTWGDTLSMYCQAWQDFFDAMQIIQREGTTCLSEKGGAYIHPAVSAKQNAIERIRKLGSELGLSPMTTKEIMASNAAAKPKVHAINFRVR